MSLARRLWFNLVVFTVLIVVSRFPLAPGQLFTFDDVNLAYSIGHFDIRISQPHPPGYPLFVMEMRALWWLRFRHIEHLLFALAVVASIASLVLIAMCGNRIMGGDSGSCAAWLLAFHPVFWYTGVTSALRVHLALVSIAVAGCCWRAWRGEGRWLLWSAIALGIGAGMRPETGPLLFPLWAVCALRAPVRWRDRILALGAMAAAVLLWLVPAMIASGGPEAFVKACLGYMSDQASVGSALFGATERRWQTTFWRLIVWTFCGVTGWAMPAVLAWRRGEGWGVGWERLMFLGLWFVPAFAFAVFVHIEDPGHALAMVPVVALFGGYLINRAMDNVATSVSRWHSIIFAAMLLVIASIPEWRSAEFTVVWVPVTCLAAGFLLKIGQIKNYGFLQREQVLIFLLAPVVLLDFTMFHHEGWYYRGTATAGWRAALDHVRADLDSGLGLTSYSNLRDTLAVDDQSIRQLRRLAAERPGRSVVIWEEGLTTWRKICFYAPTLPIAVLEHEHIRSDSTPVIAFWRGPRIEKQLHGPAPQRVAVPPGSRVIWVLKPDSEFCRQARQSLPLTPAGPVYYTDLPTADGERVMGDYEVAW